MQQRVTEAEVRLALHELQRYLSDGVAPLMVADSIDMLVRCPPDLAATAIQGWVSSQYRVSDGTPVSDFLFHALKKIHLMGEFDLVEKEPLSAYISQLVEIVLNFCPAEERESLKTSLGGLGQVDNTLAASIGILHRQGGGPAGAQQRPAARPGAASGGPMTDEVARGLKRFAAMMERLEHDVGTAGGTGPAASSKNADLVTQLLSTAALSSRSGAELQEHLERLGRVGVDARMEQVFRALGKSLPGWALGAASGSPLPLPQSHQVEAMRRLIAMAGDPQESAHRFSEMVQAAIERFNDGALPQAVTMLDLAERVTVEQRLDPGIVKSIRERTHAQLATNRLKELSERPETHALFAKALAFFPALAPPGLIAELATEERRERRKLLLALLEVHGAEARTAALHRLEACLSGQVADPMGYVQRNLVYLLRRIARPTGEAPDTEIGFLVQLSRMGNPAIVIKESLGALGQIRHEAAERALLARLHEFEQALVNVATEPYGHDEMTVFLDRTVSALSRLGTHNAHRAIVNHALGNEPAHGDTMARLAELADQDLSADKELLSHLLERLKEELPKKLLGFVVQKRKSQAVMHLIEALAGTPAPAVRQALQEIASRFPDQEFGQAAARTLASLGATSRPAEPAASLGLTGDLQLFGLPSVLQTLADASMTGALALTSTGNQLIAMIHFEGGKIRDCVCGNLKGAEAVYQLIEAPTAGTFAFNRQGAATEPQQGELMDVMQTMLEAMRRHDELQQARALVPDDVRLMATGTKPTRPPEEEDPAFLRGLWMKATSNETPAQWEATVPADSYRIRKGLAHWVEEGALKAT